MQRIDNPINAIDDFGMFALKFRDPLVRRRQLCCELGVLFGKPHRGLGFAPRLSAG